MLLASKKNPASTSTCVGIENCPDRAAAVMAVADACQRRIDEIARIIFLVLGIEIGMRLVGVGALIGIVIEMPAGLVVEAVAQHVDQNDVLPVLDRQPDGARLVEHLAARMPAHIDVAILATDGARLGDAASEL